MIKFKYIGTLGKRQDLNPHGFFQEFDQIIESIFDQILNLINKNSNLKSQRDLLLPRLISGSISI